jgi:hypothetical protein
MSQEQLLSEKKVPFKGTPLTQEEVSEIASFDYGFLIKQPPPS